LTTDNINKAMIISQLLEFRIKMKLTLFSLFFILNITNPYNTHIKALVSICASLATSRSLGLILTCGVIGANGHRSSFILLTSARNRKP